MKVTAFSKREEFSQYIYQSIKLRYLLLNYLYHKIIQHILKSCRLRSRYNVLFSQNRQETEGNFRSNKFSPMLSKALKDKESSVKNACY